MFRKHLHTYSKGIDGASEFRQKVNFIIDINEMREIIESFFPEFD
jgi:tRNA-dihydrouridine synthase B